MTDDGADDVLGSLLEGRYRVLRRLGGAGVGSVFVGEDEVLRRRCALKLLHPALAADAERAARFLREAQTIAALDHPNIVDIHSYGQDPRGTVYFVMELLAGEDLDARLRDRAARPVTVRDACRWGLQIAAAMAVVHEAGFVHRDLEASNVFLARRRDGKQVCKLLDFGIARAVERSELTRAGVRLGTPGSMSPEQIRGEQLDGRSDVYAFGVLLFKLLTGRLPFAGDALAVAHQHCEAPAPAPSSLAPTANISPRLDALVLKAMAKRPADRFATMSAVAAALCVVLDAPALESTVRGVVPDVMAEMTLRAGVPEPAAPREIRGRTAATASMRVPTPRGVQGLGLAFTALLAATSLAVLRASGGAGVGGAALGPAPAEAVPLDLSHGTTAAWGDAVPGDRSRGAARGDAVPGDRSREAGTGASPVPGHRSTKVAAAPVPADMPEPEVELPPLEDEFAGARARQRADRILRRLEAEARRCRQVHGAVDGPEIEVDYTVGPNGAVTAATAATRDALGACLAAAVRRTRFAPRAAPGRKIWL
ncbi:serine/threonine-protein kinase [Nannocystis bainbridge]|uniref:Protein kinase n=1 Tax=Nannocystis bainbridge TaxID=2995303 RepID=A0ABT5E0A2_9BACT|nr:serine/threonine-protein kinase [Nannocystis bainbridge]MDC0718850.1 protein kinase [Nannocystis bainbridge]